MVMKKERVILSLKAKTSLRDIIIYLKKHASPSIAEHVRKGIIKKCKSLKDFSGYAKERYLDELPEAYRSVCKRAPNYIQDFFESLPGNLIERVELTDEARELSEKYISEKVVGSTSRADCQHIALATINKADVLVSWNFKHIVNLERIRGYNSINFREGYQMTEIRTPKEIFNYENDNQ
jgi:plasmid stabilization system protein ParE